MSWAEILKYAAALGLDLGREALESSKSKRRTAEMHAQAAIMAAQSAKASSDAATRAAHGVK
jgi:hypothetical protein